MIALASGPPYDSSTVLTQAALVVAIIALVVPVILWQRDRARRLLAYSTPVNRKASELPRGLHERAFKVPTFDEDVADPHIVVLQVDSHSSRDIPSVDFDRGKPVIFDFAARIVKVSLDGVPDSFDRSAFCLSERSIEIGPTLIRGGNSMHITVITDGAPAVTCHSNPLIGVKVARKRADDASVSLATVVLISVQLAVVATMGAVQLSQDTAEGTITGLVCLAGIGSGTVYASRFVRVIRRKRLRGMGDDFDAA